MKPLLALLLVAATPLSYADTVYRCADGRSYSQQPCAAGQTLQVDDTRTAAQRQQAEDAAQREARLASALERERQARESAPGAPAAGIVNLRPHAAASAPAHEKHARHGSHRHKPRKKPFDDDHGSLSAPIRAPAASTP